MALMIELRVIGESEKAAAKPDAKAKEVGGVHGRHLEIWDSRRNNVNFCPGYRKADQLILFHSFLSMLI